MTRFSRCVGQRGVLTRRAANVKQVLTILLAVVLFDLVLTPTNLFGIALSLAGGAWYAAVEVAEKRRRTA